MLSFFICTHENSQISNSFITHPYFIYIQTSKYYKYMEENSKPKKSKLQKPILKSTPSAKLIPTKKTITNAQQFAPVSKSPKNIENVYDDVENISKAIDVKIQSIKQTQGENKSNKSVKQINEVNKAQEKVAKPPAGTTKKITFEHWLLGADKEKPKRRRHKNNNVEPEKPKVEQVKNQQISKNVLHVNSNIKQKAEQKSKNNEIRKEQEIQKENILSKKQNDKNNEVEKAEENNLVEEKNEPEEIKIQKTEEISDNIQEPQQQPQSKLQQEERCEIQQPVQEPLKLMTEPIPKQQLREPSIKSIRSAQSIKFERQSEQKIQVAESWSRKTCETFRSTKSSCQDYLTHVFNYYCKIHYTIGNTTTFDQVQSKMRMMSITNFMIFCRDFKINTRVEKDKLVDIFKKNSTHQKYLTVEQFRMAIEKISQLIYRHQPEQKRFGRMLMFLEIHNSLAFVKKMNKLGCSFRIKNKRGIDVNIQPKYTFKLTPNNGKTEDHITKQVKQRQKQRKILKQQNIQWHKSNRRNKVEEIYKRVIKNREKGKKKSYRNSNKQNKLPNIYQLNSIHLAKQKYYNPCQFLSVRKDNSYELIYKLKRTSQQDISACRSKVTSERRTMQLSQCTSLPSLYRPKELKLNQMIVQAKNMLMMDQSKITAHSENKRQHGTIRKQIIKDSWNIHQPGKIKMNLRMAENESPSKILQEYHNNRKYKQLTLTQLAVQSQLKNMYPTLTQTDKQATCQLEQENGSELCKLKDMIGINEQNEDELLQKLLNIQSLYESSLANMRNKIK